MPRSEQHLAPDIDRSFSEPWEAQAFAMTMQLHERGVFTWTEWADELAAATHAAQDDGDPDDGSTYYRHWLTALESLVGKRSLATDVELRGRRHAWQVAATNTPHGQPIVIDPQ